jgi:Ca2+-binding RTX toxin-like protein
MAFDGSTFAAATTGVFVGGVFSDSFSVGGADVDIIALNLGTATNYFFDVDNGTSGDLLMRIFDPLGNEVRVVDDGFRSTDNVVFSLSPYAEFTPDYTGTYYVAISPFYLRHYDPTTVAGRVSPENPLPITAGTLTVTAIAARLWPSNATIPSIAAESVADQTDRFRDDDRQLRNTCSGFVDSFGDVDMARIDLIKGDVIVIDVNGLEGNGTVLRLFNASGTQVGFDDDSGTGEDPELVYAMPATQSLYIGISGDGNASYDPLDGTDTMAGDVGEYEVIIHRNPTLIGTSATNGFAGTDGADYIVGLAGNDTINGGVGNDTLSGGDDNDRVIGGLGNDILYGDGGDDTLSGSQGDDVLVGGSGDDSLNGSVGNDLLEGGRGADRLQGREGNDSLYGGLDNDVLAGGDGDDLIFGGDGDDEITDSSGNDSMFGDGGDDRLFGGIGNDSLDGGTDADTLGGGDGNDSLVGAAGDDSLVGGRGNDRLTGGAGNDTLRGGTGDDAFVFLSTSEGLDLILDFGLTADDRIDLSAIFDATGSVVTGANLAQFVQVTPAGAGTDTFLGVDANGAVGGLSFTIVAQIVGVTPVQMFDADNFIL